PLGPVNKFTMGNTPFFMYLTYVFFLTFIIHEFNQIHNINICIDDREKIPGFHTAVKSGVLSLVPEICLVLQLNVSSLKDRIFSFFFLLGIISETADGWLAKYDDDRQVDKCKEAHDHVCRGPCNGELHEGAA